MTDLLIEQQERVKLLTLNRIEKHNAFDDFLLQAFQEAIDEATADPSTRVILIKANGRFFSSGADLLWMQKMVNYTADENLRDALVLGKFLFTLYQSPKPIVTVAQGSAFGGGVGILAASDVVIASCNAQFCFSEVKLGLIPAVISPYVIKAIGERETKRLFMSAETFSANDAKQLGLIHYCFPDNELLDFSFNYAHQLANLAPSAVTEAKRLVHQVSDRCIDQQLVEETAKRIAEIRVSGEAQKGLRAFLNKQNPDWD